MPEQDHYKVLGVKKTASLAEIKKAGRDLVTRHRADNKGSSRTKLQSVQLAIAALGTKKDRDEYDNRRKGTATTAPVTTSPSAARRSETAAAGGSGPGSKRGKHTIFGALWILLGLVLLTYLAYGLFLYLTGSNDALARAITTVFPYPAMIVKVPGYTLTFVLSTIFTILLFLSTLWLIAMLLFRARNAKRMVVAGVLLIASAVAMYILPPASNAIISYNEYLDRVETQKTINQKQKSQGQQIANSSESEVRARALDDLRISAIFKQEAEMNDLTVTSKEIDEAYKQYADRASGEESLRKQVKETFGWSADRFKKEIGIVLLQSKLRDKLATDDKLNADRKKKAEDLLAQIKGGKDFVEVAKESDDPTGQNGGDLGLVKKGEIDPAIEGPAFSLEVGKVSDIIKTKQGYVIIKVEEKQPDQVKLRQIVVTTLGIAEYFQNKFKDIDVDIFVKGLVLNPTLFSIEPKDRPAQIPTGAEPGSAGAPTGAPDASAAPSASGAPTAPASPATQ